MKLDQGFHFVGQVVTFEQNEWAPNKFNQVLVMDNPYEDRYGQKNSQYTRINIHRDDVMRVKQFADSHQGQLVRVQINLNLKSGISQKTQKAYAFNDFYMPKGLELEVIDVPKLARAS